MKKMILIILAIVFVGCSEDNKTAIKVDTIEEVPKEQPQKQVEQEVVEIVEIVEVIARTGEDIFKSCSGCHGADASKKALGKSQVIKGWSSEKIIDALNGYKAGTYGGATKAVMQGQAAALSEEDMKLVADYISKL